MGALLRAMAVVTSPWGPPEPPWAVASAGGGRSPVHVRNAGAHQELYASSLHGQCSAKKRNEVGATSMPLAPCRPPRSAQHERHVSGIGGGGGGGGGCGGGAAAVVAGPASCHHTAQAQQPTARPLGRLIGTGKPPSCLIATHKPPQVLNAKCLDDSPGAQR